MKIEYAALSDIGKRRKANEDAFYARYPLFIVADGLGGHNAGEVASSTAIQVFSELISTIYTDEIKPESLLERMKEALETADKAVYEAGRSSSDLRGMGTTMTAGCFIGSKLVVVHIGDSRLYQLRNGVLKKQTTDHTYVQHLIDIGEISEEEANNHPMRSALTQALGGEMKLNAYLKTLNVRTGDVYLFCTDGLYTMIDEGEIKEVLSSGKSPEEKAEELVKRALDAGGADNITVIVVEVKNDED